MHFIRLLMLQAFLLCSGSHLAAQARTDSLLLRILLANPHQNLQNVLLHKDSFIVQIIYTQIDRNKQNIPTFTNYHFNTDTNAYFYPASTVKLPLALLALEKLNNLNIKGVNKYTSVQIDSSYERQTTAYTDSTAKNNLPSIAHYIKKALIVSDNDAYNRLYEFVGQRDINRNLHAKGYRSTRIIRQFLGLTSEGNRHTNAIRFIRDDGRLIYAQPPAYNTDSFYFGKVIKMGKAHYDRNDSLINKPFDFTMANNIPLEDLQQMLQSVMFPESVPGVQRFNLKKSDYRFLYRYLSQYPSETNYPKYDTTEYYDSYVKYYFNHAGRRIPAYVRVFNKVGWAYGFITDVSYIVDFNNKVEFMLTSTVYSNSDNILNDNLYEYESIGLPFMSELFKTIYKYELQRPRKYKPNPKKFIIRYERRDVNDTRPAIKGVDN